MHPWYQGRLLRGLEIVVKVGKGWREEGPSRQGKLSKSGQIGKRGFVQGTVNGPVWSPGMAWKTRKAVTGGPRGRKRGVRQNRNGLRRQLSQTPPFTDDGPKTSGT